MNTREYNEKNKILAGAFTWIKWICAIFVCVLFVGAFHTEAYGDEAIAIGTAEQLQAIGSSPEYPMDGSYILTNDIDMSGISHKPVGTVEEPFAGTFDGAGYTIKNINIQSAAIGTIDKLSAGNVAGYGIFGVISQDANIKNINIYGAAISASVTENCAAGVIAAVMHNGAKIENVAVICADIDIKGKSSVSLYGAGSVAGMVWTEPDTAMDEGTTISNVYADGTVKTTGFGGENTVSGIIGCVYNEPIDSLFCAVSFVDCTFADESGYGLLTSKKYDGNGIAGKAVRAYFSRENKNKQNSIGSQLATGVLASGTVALSDKWHQEQGVFPTLVQAADIGAATDKIYPHLRRHQSLDCVTESFYVATTYNGTAVTWSSSSSNVVVDSATGFATVKVTDGVAEKVTLTYKIGDISGNINLTIGMAKDMSFNTTYAKPGETLKVQYAPAGATYKWEILDKETNESRTWEDTTGEYVVTEDDLESFIFVTVNGSKKLSMYVSSLPVVYIDSKTTFAGIGRNYYHKGNIKLSGDIGEFAPWYLYEGDVEFRKRGHSSSYYEKTPLKLKLSAKTDMYGMSGYENKHWVLVSNVLDGTLMRNSIVQQLFVGMGAVSIMDYEDVVLIYNGQYIGVYQMYEHVRIGEGRVEVYDYDRFAEDAAESIAKAMVDRGQLAAHFEKEYAQELEAAMENDYSYMDDGYVVSNDGTKHIFADYDIELPEATGGYLVVMDRYSKDANSDKQATLHTAYKLPLYIDKPGTDEKSQLNSMRESALYAYAKKFNQSFEYALHSDDFFFRNGDTHYKVTSEGQFTNGKWQNMVYTETTYQDDENDGKHYSEMFDIDSLVQNFLICEFSQNYDSMKNSLYYQKDVGKPAVVAPFWDYDWSMGNWITTRYTNMPTKWQTTLDGATEMFYQHVSWNRMLIRDPYFLMKVWEQYNSIRATVIEDIVKEGGFVDTQYDRLSKVAGPNGLKWKHLDIYRDFESAMGDLDNYLDKRVNWLDNQFKTLDTLVLSLGYYHRSDYLQVSAVTRNDDGSAHIEAAVNNASVANIVFQVNGAFLKSAQVVDGKAIIDVPAEVLSADSYNMVEVKAANASGEYLINSAHSDTGNYNLVHSNYEMFE